MSGNMSSTESLEDALVHVEQVRVLYSGLPIALLFNAILSSILVKVMWPVLSVSLAIGWLLLISVMLILRAGIYWGFRNKYERKTATQWLTYFRITIVLNGLTWGVAAYLFFPVNDLPHQAFLAFVLAGVSSAAIVSLAPDRISAISFTAPLLLPLLFNFALEGGEIPVAMSLMVALFMIFLSAAAVRLQNNMQENVALRAKSIEKEQSLSINEQRFRFILDTCPTAVRISKTGAFEVVYFNQGYAKLLEADPDHILGINPSKYYVNKDDYADVVKSLSKGEQVFDRLIELQIPERPDLPHKWTLASYLRIEYQGEPAVIGWFHDISERIHMDRMKSEFVSTVSHELRTPLTVISGSLGLMAGGAIKGLPESALQMVDLAYKNSQRLGRLINDLLDMDKLTAGKFELNMQLLPIMPLIEQAILENEGYAANRHVSVALTNVASGVHVTLDNHRFLQVMANLLSNALKFSPDDSSVDIAVVTTLKTIRVSVIDSGSGIPAAFQGRIFQKFSQADSSDTRKKGGTGLGLAISKELVERMGGSIGFSSVEGQGTTFFVEFPIM
jgi:signal transduction histidine kinase/putative flippase GtrA